MKGEGLDVHLSTVDADLGHVVLYAREFWRGWLHVDCDTNFVFMDQDLFCFTFDLVASSKNGGPAVSSNLSAHARRTLTSDTTFAKRLTLQSENLPVDQIAHFRR